MTASRPLRFGHAGGNFGLRVLLPAIRLAGHEVVAFAGRTSQRAGEDAARHGIANGVGSVGALLDLPLDAVALALPPVDCVAAAAAAADRGMAIFAEKPLGPTAASVRALDGIARAPVMVDYEFAALPSFRRLGAAIAGGEWGAVRDLRVVWNSRSRDLADGRWSWKADARQGGGVLGLYGCHVVHAARTWLGPLAFVHSERVAARTSRLAPRGAHPAAERVLMDAVAAGSVPCRFALDMAADGPPGLSWTVAFDTGVATLDNGVTGTLARFRLTFTPHGGEAWVVAEDPVHDDPVVAAVAGLLAHFGGARLNPADPWGLAAAADVLDVLEAAEPRA